MLLMTFLCKHVITDASQVCGTTTIVQIIDRRSSIAEIRLLDDAYFRCSQYIWSVPWHLLSFCFFRISLSSLSSGISSFIVILSGGSTWGNRSGFSISGCTSTFLGAKWFLKWSVNFPGSIKSRFDLFKAVKLPAKRNSSIFWASLATFIFVPSYRSTHSWSYLCTFSLLCSYEVFHLSSCTYFWIHSV